MLLYHSLTATCAVRWQLLKLRTQLSTVLRVGALCPYMADIRRWIYDGLAPSLHKKHAIHFRQLDIPLFSDSCSCASTTRTGTDARDFHTCIRNYGHLLVDFCVKNTLSDRSSRFVVTYLPKQQPFRHSFPNTFLTWLSNSFYIQITYNYWKICVPSVMDVKVPNIWGVINT